MAEGSLVELKVFPTWTQYFLPVCSTQSMLFSTLLLMKIKTVASVLCNGHSYTKCYCMQEW